jgi:predicted Rossmann fold flavoprotein
MSTSSKKLVVIGGGAAGFFCAVNAARMNSALQVILVEKTNKLLSKVKISGGGRCNVTHACFDIADMSRRYPRGGNFVKKTFHQFFTTDTLQWFKERGVEIKGEKDGRMFPATNSSQTIIECLLREAGKYSIDIRLNAEVKKINSKDGGFDIQFSNGNTLKADAICIASGGYPKTTMFEWLKELGHSIEEPVPSLFTFNMPGNPVTNLMGVSVEQARVKIIGTKLEQEGPLLITHWGMSGPAILKLSAWGARELATMGYSFRIMVNWLPAYTEQELGTHFQTLRHELAAQKIGANNSLRIPRRLWEFLLELSGVDTEKRWADLPAKEQNRLVKNICACEFDVKGKTTFKEEFVTAGGIKLNEVDSNTMQSKLIPHLYFAGEILDVDGITGGFNFQHAWTSGWIAATAIAKNNT